MELQQAKQADDRPLRPLEEGGRAALKAKLDRKAELEKSQESGAYAQAKAGGSTSSTPTSPRPR